MMKHGIFVPHVKMTRLQTQKREIKKLSLSLSRQQTLLQNRVKVYNREARQLSIIQQNVQNVQNISEELFIALEEIKLKGDKNGILDKRR